MARSGWVRWLRWATLGALVTASGCDIKAYDFAGSKIELTIANGRPTPAGQHLEIWARDGEQGIARLVPGEGQAYQVVQAVDLADPCMIDEDTGYRLWEEGAQPGPTDADRKLQAKAVLDRIHLLTDLVATPLYALVAYDDHVPERPQIADDAPPETRRKLCREFWYGPDPPPRRDVTKLRTVAYSGNPLQLTQPVNGIAFGTLDFISNKPSQIAGGVQIVTSYGLRNLVELWLTNTTAKVTEVQPDVVDCKAAPDKCRGAVILQGFADATFAREVLHVEMAAPAGGTMRGAATVYIHLDDDPVQF